MTHNYLMERNGQAYKYNGLPVFLVLVSSYTDS